MARREVKLILWVDVYLHYRSSIILRSTIIDHHFVVARYFFSLNLQTFTIRYSSKIFTFLLETFKPSSKKRYFKNIQKLQKLPFLIN